MTALAGFWSHGATEAPRLQCERMLAAQSLLASGAPRMWSAGALAIGKRLEPRLPEDRFDRGIASGADGQLMLAADIRLDNREELAESLSLGAGEAAEMSDSALLMRCWERWGAAALPRIAGDFAIAVWDVEAGTLTLARDPIGQRPLHFARRPHFTAFASMPRGLHALAGVPRAVNEDWLRGFLAFEPETGPHTPFRHVHRVEPGHVVTISAGAVQAARYWSTRLDPLRLSSNEDCVEAVRETLDRAVRARLRGADGQVAAHLSAGLDSSAVTAFAARAMAERGGRVVALTAVPAPGFVDGTDKLADEGPLAAATAARYDNIDHVRVSAATDGAVAGLDRNFLLFERPFPNLGNQGWDTAIHAEAKRRGLTVLLTGSMGNLTFSHPGWDLLPALLTRLRWPALLRQLRSLQRNGENAAGLAAATIGPLLPESVWLAIRRARGRPTRLRDFSLLKGGDDGDGRLAQRPVRLDPQTRLTALQWVDPGNFNKGWLAGWGLDVRDPTADRRLIELCLRIPAEHYLRAGAPRALARQVLSGLVPDAVLSERRRGQQAADWHHLFPTVQGSLREELGRLDRVPGGATMLDLDRARALLDAWPRGSWDDGASQRLYRVALLRAASAGHFLRKATGSNA